MRRPLKIALILGIFAVIYLILPFVFGMLTQRYTLSFVQNENNTLGKVLGIHIDIAQYNRGWFKSTALFQIEKTLPDGRVVIVNSIPLMIEHGPSYFSRGRFHAGVGLVKSNGISLGDNSPYQIDFYDYVGFEGERGTFILLSNKSAQVSNFHVDSLIIKMSSTLNASSFGFTLNGTNLRFTDPTQSSSLNIKNFQSTLLAKYESDRHWLLTFSMGLGADQLSTLIPGVTPAPLTVNAEQISLDRVHFDTKKMADILTDLIQLKQQSDAEQPVKPMAWAALGQQLLTEMVGPDTSMTVAGLSVTTPMGQLEAGYNVSFPTLPFPHDYFDLATRNVGALHVDIPHWMFTNEKTNTQFALSNFSYDVFSNTVFSRHSEMKLGAFDINSPQSTVKTPTFYASGFSYAGEVFGDPHSLSQTMEWKLARACTSSGCFDKIHSELQLSHMNYDAFRGIASATQQLVQYDPANQATPLVTQWTSLANSYMKLILPNSQVVFSNDMTTPQGDLTVRAKVSWPEWKMTANASPTPSDFMNQSQYELHVLFPIAYADALLEDARASQLAAKNSTDTLTVTSETKGPSFETQTAQLLQYAINEGYLKKDGNGYLLDLVGKGSAFTVNGKAWQMPH